MRAPVCQHLFACIRQFRGLRAIGFVAVLTLVFAFPSSALSQARATGTLVVRATDVDSAPLPDVVVTVQGPVATWVQQTGAGGTTRFPGLDPGLYTATFELAGFKTVVREELRITVARTITVPVTLELSDFEEVVTVAGQSPLVDLRGDNVGEVYTNQQLEGAPSASGLWAGVIDHIPGLVLGNIDVGGSRSAQPTHFSSRGVGWRQNTYNLDGLNNTNPDGFLGEPLSLYSTASFEEVAVSTAAHSAAVQTAGVSVNMVTKSGSNDWHAGARVFWEGPSFASNNIDDELGLTGYVQLQLGLQIHIGRPL